MGLPAFESAVAGRSPGRAGPREDKRGRPGLRRVPTLEMESSRYSNVPVVELLVWPRRAPREEAVTRGGSILELRR